MRVAKKKKGEGEKSPSLFERLLARVFPPHVPQDKSDVLLRCECGTLMWKNGEERKKERHHGHMLWMATGASMWEYYKLRRGWIK